MSHILQVYEKIATGQENKINHGDFLEKKIENQRTKR